MNEIADCIEHNVDEVREDIVKLVSGIPVEAEPGRYSAAEQNLETRDEKKIHHCLIEKYR